MSELHKKGDYDQVVKILESTLPKRAPPASSKKEKPEGGGLDEEETRRFHLDVMIDAQWKRADYRQCLAWTEVAFHEAVREKSWKGQRFVNLVENLDCCLDMMDDDFGGLAKASRSRLAQDLLTLCLQQVRLGVPNCVKHTHTKIKMEFSSSYHMSKNHLSLRNTY